MKVLLTFTLSLLLLLSSPADAMFRDTPLGHWSSMAIYDLVSLGITQGYPDGTFAGEKPMSRYETAVFLFKLQKIAIYNAAVKEKLVEELKVELEGVKESLAELKKPSEDVDKFSGDVLFGMSLGKTSAQEKYSSKIDHRIKTSFSKSLDRDFTVKINFDTIDSGYGTSGPRALNEMLNIEGKATVAPFGFWGDLAATTGPGLVVHNDSQSFMGDDFTVFELPYNTLSYSTKYKGYSISGRYTARDQSEFGSPYSSEFALSVGTPKFDLPVLNETDVRLTPRFLSKIPDLPTFESEDVRLELSIKSLPSPKMEIGLTLGMRGTGFTMAPSDDRYLASLVLLLNDYFSTGTYFSLSFNKVGAQYRVDGLNKYEFGLVDQFSRLILDGTTNLGVSIAQKMTDTSRIFLNGTVVATNDLRYGADQPGTSMTLQEGYELYIPSGMVLNISHKTYEVPSGTADAVDNGIFKRAVPATSDTFSVSLDYSF